MPVMRPSMVSSTSGPPLSAGGIFVNEMDGVEALLPHPAVARRTRSHIAQPRDRQTPTTQHIVRRTPCLSLPRSLAIWYPDRKKLPDRRVQYIEISRASTRMSLAAVAASFVGDIAYVIRIETLRSTPLIVDASATAKAAPDRLQTLRLGLL